MTAGSWAWQCMTIPTDFPQKELDSQQHIGANIIASWSQMAQWPSDRGTPRYYKIVGTGCLSFNFCWLRSTEFELQQGNAVGVSKGKMKKRVSIFRLSEQEHFRSVVRTLGCRRISVSRICEKRRRPYSASFHGKTF